MFYPERSRLLGATLDIRRRQALLGYLPTTYYLLLAVHATGSYLALYAHANHERFPLVPASISPYVMGLIGLKSAFAVG